jgi:hypothetical protein
MSLNNIELPNEVIRLILFYCQTPKDYLSQSLVNRQWSCEAQWITSLMKTRFARKITSLNQRRIIWHFDIRVTVIGHGEHLQRHGLEECVQTYHRVGGPSSSVYYLQRSWQDGKLHGLEIIREINQIWYDQYYRQEKGVLDHRIVHPYDGLFAVDSMRQYRRHLIVPKNSILPKDCDYLGKILFKYEWNSGTLEDSQQLQRNLIDEQDQSDVNALFDYLHHIDLHEFPIPI